MTQLDLGGEPVAGDGLVLAGRTLWAVEGQGDVVTIRLDRGLAPGRRRRLLLTTGQAGWRAGVC